ncbi:MAG TPA: hypothetical protein VGS08_02175 [Candidatus Saccharimonadales bacterium]|nr:hypothetical protein [Candidatus Saccharimonadales bacterium]
MSPVTLTDMHSEQVRAFQTSVWQYFRTRGRHDLPWRRTEGGVDPYRILVSEIMLQQTQVNRVIPKYINFLEAFPDWRILSGAELGDVLRVWSGLGYNRRAKYLWQAAHLIVNDYDGQLPRHQALLQRLPGVGTNTAGAIAAYAWNEPTVFVETNIRTVFIHHWFSNQTPVDDRQIRHLVRQTLPNAAQTRQWYWALMDYGSCLKDTVGNLSRLSAHYTRQGRFTGSSRQIRGQVLRLLMQTPETEVTLQRHIADDRLPMVIEALLREGMIHRIGQRLCLGA